MEAGVLDSAFQRLRERRGGMIKGMRALVEAEDWAEDMVDFLINGLMFHLGEVAKNESGFESVFKKHEEGTAESYVYNFVDEVARSITDLPTVVSADAVQASRDASKAERERA